MFDQVFQLDKGLARLPYLVEELLGQLLVQVKQFEA